MLNRHLFLSRRSSKVPHLLVLLLSLLVGLAATLYPAQVTKADNPIYVRPDGDDVNCDGTVDAAYLGAGGPDLACAVQTIGAEPWTRYHAAQGLHSRLRILPDRKDHRLDNGAKGLCFGGGCAG